MNMTITEVQARLSEVIQRLAPGEELIITENDRPVAKLIATPRPQESRKVPQLGTQRGSVMYMVPDFDAPLKDLKEYME